MLSRLRHTPPARGPRLLAPGTMARLLSVCVVASVVALAVASAAAASPPVVAAPDYNWTDVMTALQNSLDEKVMPGYVAGVASADGTLFLQAGGHFTYGQPDPVAGDSPADTTADTWFDLASLSKVTGTTTAVAQFYQRGELDLNMPLMDPYLLGPGYGGQGKATITPLNCLVHNAGYPPDPVPDYWSPEFGCLATMDYHPPETFDCNQRIYESLLNQTLINPVGAVYVYSDLSFITLQYVVGTLAKNLGYVTPDMLLPACNFPGTGITLTCYFEAYVRTHVFEAAGMNETGYLPPKERWANAAPTWLDDYYRHRYIQGQVSDENSYALGGVAGHAGVFSTAPQLLILMKKLMFAPADSPFINSTTVKLFTTAHNLTQSSRALGWDTNSYAENTYRGCGNLSTLTYTHTGYTGTELCNDPTRQLITVLLTNRCYPNKTGNLGVNIEHARQHFNNAVLKVFTAGQQRKRERELAAVAAPATTESRDHGSTSSVVQGRLQRVRGAAP